ncbi:MAG: FHA domain-containing protein [Myxococcota bacterium]|nr:FHA domain-containing protein [Myxococcota bacterium]
MARLIVFRGRNKERTYTLASRSMVIGRGDDADIRVDNPLVSRSHALLSFRGSRWVIEDLDSPNGLYVNGERISEHELAVGDRIELGRHVLIFEGSGKSDFDVDTARNIPQPLLDDDEATTILSPMEIKNIQTRARQRMNAHVLMVWDGQRKEVPLSDEQYLVGYSDECSIRLPGKALFGKVVAELKRSGTNWTITSRASRGKVKITGSMVDSKQLRDRDRIQIRNVTLQFHDGIGPSEGDAEA